MRNTATAIIAILRMKNTSEVDEVGAGVCGHVGSGVVGGGRVVIDENAVNSHCGTENTNANSGDACLS
jgi:hypothetical protein